MPKPNVLLLIPPTPTLKLLRKLRLTVLIGELQDGGHLIGRRGRRTVDNVSYYCVVVVVDYNKGIRLHIP